MDLDEIYECLQEHAEHLNTHTECGSHQVSLFAHRITHSVLHVHMHAYKQSGIYNVFTDYAVEEVSCQNSISSHCEVSGYLLIIAAAHIIFPNHQLHLNHPNE